MLFSMLAIAAALVSTVSAHGGVIGYSWGGTWYKGFAAYNPAAGQVTAQREWDTFDPIQDPTLQTMQCNANGKASSLQWTVAAGTAVTANWNPWPHSLGPVTVWMAKCAGPCSSYTPSGNVWFKIDQRGLESGNLATGRWGMADLIANNNSWTTTIPKTLPAGNYLLRHDLLAIHTSNAPQWYPECLQLTVTGSGTKAPTSAYLAAIPGVYSMSDPSVNINVYSNENQAVTTYKIPGPALWTG